MRSLFEALFGCTHSRMTFPQTPRRIGALNRFQRKGQPYVVCLDCGMEFSYSWREMRRGPRLRQIPDTSMRERLAGETR